MTSSAPESVFFKFIEDAMIGDDAEVLEFLQKYPDDINRQNMHGSALHKAAWNKNTSTVELLLEHGADIDIQKNDDQKTPLILAVQAGDLKTVDLLIKEKADIHLKDTNGETAFLRAALMGFDDLLKKLHAEGSSLDEKDCKDRTALMYAIKNSNIKTAKWLLEQGSSMEEADIYGDKPIAYVRDPAMGKFIFEWNEKQIEEHKTQELATELSDYSAALKEDTPAPKRIQVRGLAK